MDKRRVERAEVVVEESVEQRLTRRVSKPRKWSRAARAALQGVRESLACQTGGTELAAAPVILAFRRAICSLCTIGFNLQHDLWLLTWYELAANSLTCSIVKQHLTSGQHE